MARTGTFAGFYFDPEVFADYMSERPTWSNAIIASGILRQDSTIMDLIGTKGNVATLPFYTPLDINDFEPLNNDGLTDNVPVTTAANKQTTMLIQRMKAWKEQDFTKELTGADPLAHVAQSVSNYYSQVWERELMNIMDAVLALPELDNHITDITTETEDKITDTTLIYAQQKALGDMANGFGLLVMNSMIYARYQALGLVDFNKYTITNAIEREVNLPTVGGLVTVVSDRYTVDLSGGTPVYKSYIVGQGSFLEADKRNYEDPYYTDYDPETTAGVRKLYTKQGKVIHPNGFSIDTDSIVAESPTFTELGDTDKWSLKMNEKNIHLGVIKSVG